jgi:hypothetical protein
MGLIWVGDADLKPASGHRRDVRFPDALARYQALVPEPPSLPRSSPALLLGEL